MIKPGVVFLLILVALLPAYGQRGLPIDYYSAQTSSSIPTDRATVLQGKKLFSGHCSECHTFCQQKTGPALASVTDRRPLPWLIAFITSSQSVINSGDQYSQFLYKSYSNTIMPDFKFLSEQDILTILSYIQSESSASNDVSGVNGQPIKQNKIESHRAGLAAIEARETHQEQGKKYDMWEKSFKIGMIGVVIITLVIALFLLIRFWKRIKRKNTGSG